jgi:soluble lytic murein transglycosylase-like protein
VLRSSRIVTALIALLLVGGLVGTAVIGALGALGGRMPAALQPGVDSVPMALREELRAAAKRCPAVPVEIFAAQMAQESSWDSQAVSPAGAQGLAQFMPPTWEQYGIDASGDGVADVWDPVDAMHSAAELNCINRKLVRDVPGNRLDNILAAYNAGFSAVREYQGVPPFPETENYVARIKSRAQTIRY